MPGHHNSSCMLPFSLKLYLHWFIYFISSPFNFLFNRRETSCFLTSKCRYPVDLFFCCTNLICVLIYNITSFISLSMLLSRGTCKGSLANDEIFKSSIHLPFYLSISFSLCLQVRFRSRLLLMMLSLHFFPCFIFFLSFSWSPSCSLLIIKESIKSTLAKLDVCNFLKLLLSCPDLLYDFLVLAFSVAN